MSRSERRQSGDREAGSRLEPLLERSATKASTLLSVTPFILGMSLVPIAETLVAPPARSMAWPWPPITAAVAFCGGRYKPQGQVRPAWQHQ